jgi:NADPH-dependent 7-cyano-7-deazaguanine reductase QueF
VRVLERRYSPSFSGFRVQNFTVRSLDDVAIPASPHTQMPRTCRRVNKICRPWNKCRCTMSNQNDILTIKIVMITMVRLNRKGFH